MPYNKYRSLLQGRNLLSLNDFNFEEITAVLELASDLKNELKNGIPHRYLEGKTLGMIFQKASTRTRVSFEVGMFQLGGYALFLSTHDLQMGRGEPVRDTALTLSRYVDGIMIRTFDQAEVEELAQHATVPVINGLTDRFHPCQALADLLTIIEHKGRLKGVKISYFGDGNNVAHSLLLGCSKTGMHMTVCTPDDYAPEPEVVALAREAAKESGGKVELTANPAEAAEGSDVIYTDVWTSMGQEAEKDLRKSVMKKYQVNRELIEKAEPGAIVMHCLPAHREKEITAEVMESSDSVIFDQAENRLHAQKSLMALVM